MTETVLGMSGSLPAAASRSVYTACDTAAATTVMAVTTAMLKHAMTKKTNRALSIIGREPNRPTCL